MDRSYEFHITSSNPQLENFLKFSASYVKSEWGNDVEITTP